MQSSTERESVRWTAWIALVVVVAVLIFLLTNQYLTPFTVTDSDDVSQGARVLRDRLADIQEQLRTTDGIDAEVQCTIYFQGPVAVRVARHKPDFLFIHVSSYEDNPATWYWFDNHQLYVYEEWPNRPPQGICVSNLMQIAEGNTNYGFELVVDASKAHAYYGYVALSLLRLFQDADPERLEISKTDLLWQLTGKPHTDDPHLMELFATGTGDHSDLIFELPQAAQTGASTPSLRIKFGPAQPWGGSEIPPEAGVVAEFDALCFSLDRSRLKFPAVSSDLLETIDLSDRGALNSDFSRLLRPVRNLE